MTVRIQTPTRGGARPGAGRHAVSLLLRTGQQVGVVEKLDGQPVAGATGGAVNLFRVTVTARGRATLTGAGGAVLELIL